MQEGAPDDCHHAWGWVGGHLSLGTDSTTTSISSQLHMSRVLMCSPRVDVMRMMHVLSRTMSGSCSAPRGPNFHAIEAEATTCKVARSEGAQAAAQARLCILSPLGQKAGLSGLLDLTPCQPWPLAVQAADERQRGGEHPGEGQAEDGAGPPRHPAHGHLRPHCARHRWCVLPCLSRILGAGVRSCHSSSVVVLL